MRADFLLRRVYSVKEIVRPPPRPALSFRQLYLSRRWSSLVFRVVCTCPILFSVSDPLRTRIVLLRFREEKKTLHPPTDQSLQQTYKDYTRTYTYVLLSLLF